MPNEEVKTGTVVQSQNVSTPSTPSVTETVMSINPDDKNVSSEDLKNFIQKETAKKVSDTKPPEKSLDELKAAVEEKPAEKVEPEQRVAGEKPAEKAPEPQVTKDVTPSLQEQVAELVEKALSAKQQDKPADKEPEPEPDIRAEDITAEILADPAETSKVMLKVINQTIKKEVDKKLKELTKSTLEPFAKKIEPVAQKIESDTINNFKTKATEKFPELGSDAKFGEDVKKFITENKSLVNEWHVQGKNPFLKAAQIVKSERLDELLNTAKQAGIKEGEERSKTAVKAFAEGGGKPTTAKPLDVDKMTAEELGKYLPRKVR